MSTSVLTRTHTGPLFHSVSMILGGVPGILPRRAETADMRGVPGLSWAVLGGVGSDRDEKLRKPRVIMDEMKGETSGITASGSHLPGRSYICSLSISLASTRTRHSSGREIERGAGVMI